MQNFIIEIMNQFGYLGIIFLITIENIFPPIPSEVILTFGGFMTTYSDLTVMGTVIFSTVGSVLGAFILYYVGYFLSPQKMEKVIRGPVGKVLRLKMEDIEKSKARFADRGKSTIFFCRFIPIVRSLISIPAGMYGMDIGIFTILTTLGSFIWNLVLISLGAFAGSSWMKITSYVKEYGRVGKVVFWSCLLFLVIRHFWKQKKKK